MGCIDPKDMPPDSVVHLTNDDEVMLRIIPMSEVLTGINEPARLVMVIMRHDMLHQTPAVGLTEKETVHLIQFLQESLQHLRVLPLPPTMPDSN